MTRKTFYSLMCKDGVIGAKKQNGYKIKLDGIKIYLYQTEVGNVHFMNPSSGMSIYIESSWGHILDVALREETINKILTRIADARGREEYSLQCKIFKKYKKAKIMDEKYSRVIKEIQKKRRDKS